MYTVIDKTNINGKIRNIYVKKNDNYKEKYIKIKGEFIRYFDNKDYYIITYKNNIKIFPNKKIFEEHKKELDKNPNKSYIFPKNKIKKVYRKTPGPVRPFKAYI